MVALGTLPDWLVAVGTVGTLAAALIQIARERVNRLTAERSALARELRAQAERVSAWYGGYEDERDEDGSQRTRLSLLNASSEPVYQVVVSLVFIQGAAPHTGEELAELEPGFGLRTTLAVLPPGRWKTLVEGGWAGMHRRPGAEIAFTDAAGRHWVRRANGMLDQLQDDPVTHFRVPLPAPWLEPISD